MNIDWLEDVRMAARALRRGRTFYLAAALTLAVGMAGATVMFTLVRGILLRPLPVPDEARLIVSWRTAPSGPATHVPYRASDVEEIARASRLFERVTGVGYNGAYDLEWTDAGTTMTARTAVVMGDFFRVAAAEPVVGRTLMADDDHVGAKNAVVLSQGAWQRLFGGSHDVIGRQLVARGRPFSIVGVMPADFEYPRGVEMWTTLSASASIESNEAFRTGLLRDVELLGRVRPGVTTEQATGELSNIMSLLDRRAPPDLGTGFRPVVQSFKRVVVGDIDAALTVLFAAVTLILVIAGANVANLLMLQGERRRSEFAVRAALGAARAHLIRQVLAESVVVSLVAGGVALVFTLWTLQTVVMLVPNGLPRLSSIRLDTSVMLFEMAVAALTSVAAGLMPALAASRFDLSGYLRAGGRGLVGSIGHRARATFVVAQVALAVTVVAAAGLLIRSLEHLQSADMGLAADRIVFAELNLPEERYRDRERRRQFLEALLQRVDSIPGVERATPINVRPFAGATGWDVPRFTADGQSPTQAAANPSLNFEVIHPTYFATLAVPILRGRAFAASDRKDAPQVAIVSQDVAAAAWPRQDPIGKRLKFGGFASSDEWLTIVGVAAVTRYRELATPRPTVYVPADQFMVTADRLAIRTSKAASAVAGPVREAVRSVDPAVRVPGVVPYAEFLRIPLAWPRFNALLLSVFASVALLLSSVGLYTVMAASVRQRYGEIGVRIALGATATDVRRLVLGEGLKLTAAGAAFGLGIALVTTRLLRTLLFETQAMDPIALIAAATVLVGASLFACTLPARRAARVDPVHLLRSE